MGSDPAFLYPLYLLSKEAGTAAFFRDINAISRREAQLRQIRDFRKSGGGLLQ